MYYKRRCKITFICHGATIYSEDGRISDVENYPPLSELGVDETLAVTRYIKDRGVKNDMIYTSPAVRTIQSAMMIAKACKKEYTVIDELKTRAYGTLNGLTYSKIFKKYKNGLSDKLISEDKTIKDFEDSKDFIKRITQTIEALVNENIGNRIIIVTHPEVIQAAICGALEIPADKLHKIFIRTGSLTQISYFEHWASLVYSDYVPL